MSMLSSWVHLKAEVLGKQSIGAMPSKNDIAVGIAFRCSELAKQHNSEAVNCRLPPDEYRIALTKLVHDSETKADHISEIHPGNMSTTMQLYIALCALFTDLSTYKPFSSSGPLRPSNPSPGAGSLPRRQS